MVFFDQGRAHAGGAFEAMAIEHASGYQFATVSCFVF
jgi:hypothetical protein